jgi:hypothetical protein
LQPEKLENPLIKLKYSENLVMKNFTLEEILNFYNSYQEYLTKENSRHSYVQKNSYRKVSSIAQNPQSSTNNFMNFLNSYHQGGEVSNRESLKQNQTKRSYIGNNTGGSGSGHIVPTNLQDNKKSLFTKEFNGYISNNYTNQNQNVLGKNSNVMAYNNLVTNAVSSSYLNLKLTNFAEILNKALKDSSQGSSSNNQQQVVSSFIPNSIVNSAPSKETANQLLSSLQGNPNNLIKSNSFGNQNLINSKEKEIKENKEVLTGQAQGITSNQVNSPSNNYNQTIDLNKNFKKFISNFSLSLNSQTSQVLDLVNFFVDNNFNFQNFCEVIQFLNNIFLKDEKISKKYIVVLIKINRSHNIFRVPNTVYDTILVPKTYFLILEGEDYKLKTFLDDRKFIMDTVLKYISDDRELNAFINKKIHDLSERIEKFFSLSNQTQNFNLNSNQGSNTNNLSNLSESEKNEIYDLLKKTKNSNFNFNNFLNKTDANLVVNFSTQNSSVENKILFKCKALRILPEGHQQGLLLITSYKSNLEIKNEIKFVEFIPITNNFKNINLKFKLSKIQSIAPYRYLYKNRGMQIFLYQSSRSKLFTFDNDQDYQMINDYLSNSSNSQNINTNFTNIKYYTDMWTNGLMSNYEYLLYLNFMGSRSFNDLSQYPVFPWVITNYEDSEEEFDISEEKNYRDLSKPVGALNPEKFEKFNKKFLEMCLNYSITEPPYLYGTHYSTPAYVIYFLTRSHPMFQLQIQNGTYGPADRMLNSLRDCWNFIYGNSIGNEVMELTPEFYQSNGEFLINIHNIQLGKSKNCENVNDVTLPRWAKTHKNFISICRAALESEYVSSNINSWIDLIFGYQQRGKGAEANDNLFYHITYDTYNYDDFPEDKKSAAFTQILQFGQTPKLLFTEAHPKKKSLDVLNYQIQSNPKEMIETIEKYKRENEKLENSYKKMVDAKFMEKQRLINEYKEIDKKRTDKINKLKE